MSCSHKRVWEYQSVDAFHSKRVEELCADGFEPFGVAKGMPSGYQPYDGEYAFDCVQLKRLKPCEECPKEMKAHRKTIGQMCKEEGERMREFDESVQQKLKDIGILR